MADGSIEFSVELDPKDAEKELTNIKKKIMQLEAELHVQQGRKTALEEELDRAGDAAVTAENRLAALIKERDRLKALTPSDGTDYLSAKVQLQGLEERIKVQQTDTKELKKEFEHAAAAVEKCDKEIQKTSDSLKRQETLYGEIAQAAAKLPTEVRKTSSVSEEAEKRMKKFANRVGSIVSSLFVYSVINRALSAAKSYFWEMIHQDERAKAATEQLKAAMESLAQPVVNRLIPAFTAFVNLLTQVVSLAAQIGAMLFGASEATAELEGEADAIKGVGGAAKKAAGQLASFDEINRLNDSSGGGGTSAAASTAKAGSGTDISSLIGEKLTAIEVLVGGALLALGAILAFSGANVPLGIGLMAAGALTLAAAVKENWSAIEDALQGPLGAVAGLVGTALFVVGSVLLFSGANIPLGLALMAAGAVGLMAAASVDWNTVEDVLTGPVGAITALVSSALLALGAILAFSGANVPLGIGLMAAGAIGLATVARVNWATIQNALRGPVGTVTALVSTALLALGAILTFSGANVPLGIGLMAAGAIGLATVARVNWDTIQNALRGPVGTVTALASAALLALGVVLLFTGAGIPLGLGLILAGAAGLATAATVNWDTIKEHLQATWAGITSWFNKSLKPKLTLEFWTEKFSAIGNGFRDGIKSGINAGIEAVEKGLNWIVDKINTLNFSVPDWVPRIGGEKFGFSIPSISIPRLAAGAVIPPNREFLAVLGDQSSGNNVEAPESLLQAMADRAASANTALLREIIQLMKDGRVLVVNDATFAELVYKSNNNAQNRHGGSLVSVRSMG